MMVPVYMVWWQCGWWQCCGHVSYVSMLLCVRVYLCAAIKLVCTGGAAPVDWSAIHGISV